MEKKRGMLNLWFRELCEYLFFWIVNILQID